MKKIISIFAIVVLALCMVSCGNQNRKNQVQEETTEVVDSVSVDSVSVDSTVVETVPEN